MKKGFLLSLFSAISFFGTQNAQAQCSAPSSMDATYCPGQPTVVETVDPASNVKYAWYTALTDDVPDYGVDGEGREFYTSSTTTVYYEKETYDIIGPVEKAPAGGIEVANDGVVSYRMVFNTSNTLIPQSYKVVVKMEDPAETYRFGTRFVEGGTTDTTYSQWETGQTSDFTSLGSDLYLVDVPVTLIEIPAGTGHQLEFISSDGGGAIAVESFYWWPAGEFSGNTYISGGVEIENSEQTVGGSAQSPILMDWDVVLKCDREQVDAVLSNACCTPVGDNFSINASTFNPGASDFPVTLTATGADVNASMYYYWFDTEGNPINDGLNLSSIQVNDVGTYRVRVVNEQADISYVACYGSSTALLGVKSIFAPEDTTICIGDPYFAYAYGAEGNYEWSSTDPDVDLGIVDKDQQETAIAFTEEGVFTLTVTGDVLLGNLAVDGKFDNWDDAWNGNAASSGSWPFETTLDPVDGIGGDGQFRVEDRIRTVWDPNRNYCESNPDYWRKFDASSGTWVDRGKIFYADAPGPMGAPAPADPLAHAQTHYLWRQQVNVEAGQTYTFSMDVSEWHESAPPEIMLVVDGQALNLSVNGTDQGTTIYAPPGNASGCVWETLSGTYTPATSKSIFILVAEVANVNSGHEFAMDDITFSTGRGRQSDDFEVTVQNCFDFQVRADTTLCVGDALPLYTTSNNGVFIDWKDQSGTVVSTDEVAEAYPLTNQTYYATVKFPVLNFIKNGDFEDGNELDYTMGYAYATSNVGDGKYYVGTSSSPFTNPGYQSQTDHTTGSGEFMIIGANTSLPNLISKTIKVDAGKEYAFQAWLANLHSDITSTNNGEKEIDFNLRVDGVVVNTFTLGMSDYDWYMFEHVWTPSTTGSVDVVLEYNPSFSNPSWYPIGIDDVRIAQIDLEETKSFEATVNNCFELEAMADATVCIGDPITLTTVKNDGFIKEWTNSDGDVVSTEPEAFVYPVKNEVYTVSAVFPVQQLLQNGDFEGGTTLDFTTNLTPETNSALSPSRYVVGTGSHTKVASNSNVVQHGDHTKGDLTGNMFIGMFDQGSGNTILEKDIAVTAGESYGFSAWLIYLYAGSDGIAYPVELYVDNVLVKSITVGTNIDWVNLLYAWEATATGTANIRLDVKSVSGMQYNRTGFALDDIEIAKLGLPATDNVAITADICNVFTIADNGCNGSNYEAEVTTDAQFDGWFQADGTTLETTNTTLSVSVATPTDFIAKISAVIGNEVVNGDFEAGDDGSFTSAGGTHNPTQNWMGTDKYVVHNSSALFERMEDVTGDGDFLISTPHGNNKEFYQGTPLPLSAGSDYVFEFDFVYLSNQIGGPHDGIDLYLGSTLLTTFNPATDNTWQKLSYSWTQASAVTEAIRLVSKNTPKQGSNVTQDVERNGIGIDNLKLGQLLSIGEQTITAQPCTPPAVDSTVTLCANDAIGINLADYELGMTDGGASTADGWFNSEADANANTGAITPTTGLTVANGDVFYLRTTDGGSGNGVAELTFVVNNLPAVTIDAFGPYCAGDAAVALTGTPATGGVFKSGGSIITNFDPSTATGSPFEVWHIYTDANGCTDSASTNITVNAIPSNPSVTTAALEYCEGETVTNDLETEAGVTGSGTLTWYTVATGGTSSTTAPSIATGTAGTTSYYVSDVVTACESGREQIDVTINELPTASISGGGEFCKDDTPGLTVTITGGTSPYDIEYTDHASAAQSLTGATSPATINVAAGATIAGDYTLVKVTDSKGCEQTTFTTDVQSISRTTDLTISSVSAVCDYATKTATVSFGISDGTPTYTYPVETPATGALTSGTYEASFLADGNTTYEYHVSDASGCTDNTNVIAVPSASINCACPVTATIANTAVTEICDDGSSVTQIEVTVGGSVETTPVYSFTINTPSGTLTEADAASVAGNVYTFDVDEDGTYSISSVSDQSCTGSGSGTATVTVHDLPTADISAGGEFCKEATPNLVVTLTGKAPYSIDYTDETGAAQNIVAASSPANIPVAALVTGDYTLVKVTDDNSCEQSTFTTAVQSISRTTDVTITGQSAVCNYVTKEATVTFDIANGTPGYTYPVETPASGIFTAGTYTASFPAIGATSYEFHVSDASGCTDNTNVIAVPSASINCDCPVTATIANTLVTEICNDGSTVTQIEVTVGGSNETTPVYGFTINTPSGTLSETDAASVSGNVYTFDVNENGNYTIASVNDQTCTGAGTGTASVTVHDLPTAVLSNGGEFCKEATPSITITLTGKAPYDVEYSVDGAAQSPVALTSDNETLTIPASLEGVVEVTRVEDANGCILNATGVTETITRTPDLTITSPMAVCDFATKELTVSFGVAGGKPTYTYPVEHQTSGTFTAGTYSVTFPANGPTDYEYQVSDQSGCVDNTAQEAIKGNLDCSCPTVATLTTPSGDEFCAGGSTDIEINITGGTGPYTFILENTTTGTQFENQTSTSTTSFTVPVNEGGTYTLTTIQDDVAMCGSSNSVTIERKELPVLDFVGPKTFCANDAITALEVISSSDLDAFPMTVGYTDATGATSTETITASGELLGNTTAGTHSITSIVDANNCTATGLPLTETLTINDLPTVTISGGGDYCEGYTLPQVDVAVTTTTGSTNFDLTYAIDGNMATSTVGLTGVLPSSDGTYTVSSIKDNVTGCVNNAPVAGTVTITEELLPRFSLISNGKTTLCLGVDAADIITNIAGMYDWKIDGVQEVNAADFTKSDFTSGGTYSISATTQPGTACQAAGETEVSSLNAISLTIYEQPNPSIVEPDQTICLGQGSVSLTVNGSGGDYIWYQDGVQVGTGGSITMSQKDESGSYTVSESNAGCAAETSTPVQVDVVEVVFDVIANPDRIEQGEQVHLSTNGNADVYTWENQVDGALVASHTGDEWYHYPPEYGWNSYIVTGAIGTCEATEIVQVAVRPPIVIPTAFTPNGDGLNDTWVIQGLDLYQDAKISVYNRWGQVVHIQYSGYTTPWDGARKDNGKTLPMGVYYYIIETNEQGKDPISGTVTIME